MVFFYEYKHEVKVLFFLAVVLICVSNTQCNKKQYIGELFPAKYLLPDENVLGYEDLNHYIRSLKKIVDYFSLTPNHTDVNTALGVFFMKSILKRTLQDDRAYFLKNQLKAVKHIISKSDYTLSHYIYGQKDYGYNDLEHRVSLIFMDDSLQVHAIGDFTTNKLTKWLKRESYLNNFSREFDTLSLPKEEYIQLVEFKGTQHIQVDDSDICISRVAINPVPIDLNELHPCRYDPHCFDRIYRAPSVAYSLSHRMVNNLILRHVRRCYIRSAHDDAIHMEMLCASMYREAVYIARRGYFARDVFLEHVALCGLLGFEEFFRRHWFWKAASWIDEDGCIQENLNYERNRTTYVMMNTEFKSSHAYKKRLNKRKQKYLDLCHHHPMDLLMIVLGHGIRRTIRYIGQNIGIYF